MTRLSDSALRGILLRKAYEKRSNPWQTWKTSDFADVPEDINESDIWRVTDQLAQHSMLDFKAVTGGQGIRGGRFNITALGVDVIEGVRESPMPIMIDQRQTFHINSSSNFQAGSNNTQNITQTSIEALIQQIDASAATPEQKREAKGLLAQLLEHPIFTSIVGGAVEGLMTNLRGSG